MTKLSGDLHVIDDEEIIFGTNSDLKVQYDEDGKAGFNQGFYKLDNGTLIEFINNSTNLDSLKNQVSFMPNFMGDKMSFIQTIEYPNGDVLFERWERLSCEVENCYKLRSRKD